MIARHVHAHTPAAQLARPQFSQYAVPSVKKGRKIMDIDALPCYCDPI
jgi:hypothetical protein